MLENWKRPGSQNLPECPESQLRAALQKIEPPPHALQHPAALIRLSLLRFPACDTRTAKRRLGRPPGCLSLIQLRTDQPAVRLIPVAFASAPHNIARACASSEFNETISMPFH